jgi:hypothetical protein
MTPRFLPIAIVDHLVYAAPDLDSAVGALEARVGVRAAAGGRHPDEGTHNALLALGPAAYLEIVAPDPAQAPPPRPRWFGVDGVRAPRLVAWAAKAADLERRAAEAERAGVRLGAVRSGGRARSDGVALSWRFTDPHTVLAGGIVPFLIDWGATPHPAGSAPAGLRLVDLRAEHPDPPSVRALLERLGIDLPVAAGPAPALIATLDTPRGRVEIR